MGSSGSLNHIYRTVWNQALGSMVAVAEISAARGKSVSRSGTCAGAAHTNPLLHLRTAMFSMAIALAWGAAPTPVLANPTGGVAIQGQASFTTNGNNLLVTTQNGAGLNHSAINWQSFSIPTGSTTYFQQPNASSTSINRVVTNTPSLIFGALGSNGNLVLVNQSGITVGAGAVVDTAGFTASALRMSDADALSGRMRFGDASATAGVVSVLGNVLARSGDVVLMGSNVDTGANALVQAPNGSTVLAAGQQIEITGRGLEGIVMQVQAPTDSAVNLGTLKGDAVGIFAGTLKHSGLIQATTATLEGGRVVLRATQHVEDSGVITASGASGGSVDISTSQSNNAANPGAVIQSGAIDVHGTTATGGSVHIQTDSLLATAAIDASGENGGGVIAVQATRQAISTSSAHYTVDGGTGTGGSILLSAKTSNYTSGTYIATGATGGDITLAGDEIKLASAQLDASGAHGGGRVQVGGLEHGAPGFGALGVDLANASNVYTNSQTSLKADALQDGNGGSLVLWADQNMRASGNLSAKGGAAGGDGGNAEVSGAASLGFSALANLSALHGKAGTLLLDPHNIVVEAGSAGWTGLSGTTYLEILDPTPTAAEGFGNYQNTVLPSGNIVVASPFDGAMATGSGAVYLFTSTGTLISALVGSSVGDHVGSSGLGQFSNGNVLVRSSNWSSGSNANAGAVTWMNGTTGALSTGGAGGAVSPTNSLVGSSSGDLVGNQIQVSGNAALVLTPNWTNAGNAAAGAVSWMNGADGTLSTGGLGGAISTANSLVGSSAGDLVGLGGITWGLAGGNIAISSSQWGSGGVSANAKGAVTWMNWATGALSNGTNGGVVAGVGAAPGNSLVGSTSGDKVGIATLITTYSSSPGTPYPTDVSGVTLLGSGNFLVYSNNWSNGGTAAKAGAVSWINGSNGTLTGGSTGGAVSATNSLVGTNAGDRVGTVTNPVWYGSIEEIPLVSLSGSNYLIRSSWWGSGGTASAAMGAVTWLDGNTGLAGAVSSSNSIVGSQSGDRVGVGLTDTWTADPGVVVLPNGNYVVFSSAWGGGRGAVTWGDGANGTSGALAATSSAGFAASVVGVGTGDRVGAKGMTLQAGGSNFIIDSPWYDYSALTLVDSGAATWVDGSNGHLSDTLAGGAVGIGNSLLGGFSYDNVGDSWALTNGNFLATTPVWSGGSPSNAYGAVTWIDGTSGKLSGGSASGGLISAANSLVGSSPGDMQSLAISELAVSGNILLTNYTWNGAMGANTWMNGNTGELSNSTGQATVYGGVISAANSLVGSAVGEISSSSYIELPNGNLIFVRPNWGYQPGFSAQGAVTWMNASGQINSVANAGLVSGGSVSADNSLVGNTGYFDQVASSGVVVLNGVNANNVVVSSPHWNNNAGAATWLDGSNGQMMGGAVGGFVSSTNSSVGYFQNDYVGDQVLALSNGNYVVRSPNWSNGAPVASSAGAVTWGNGATGTAGQVSAANSLVGNYTNQMVGTSVTEISGGNYLVTGASSSGNDIGSLTWVHGSDGKLTSGAVGGVVSPDNSLVGSVVGDNVGSSYVTTLSNGNLVFSNEFWSGGKGAVTWMGASDGHLADGSNGGSISVANSLVGAKDDVAAIALGGTQGDHVGAYGVYEIAGFYFDNYVVASPAWINGTALAAGAMTFGNGSTGGVGVVGAGNSLVGSAAGDRVGSGNVVTVSDYSTFWNLAISSPEWGSAGVNAAGKGAVTWMNGATGALSDGTSAGAVSAANSLVGSSSGDQVGSYTYGYASLQGINVFDNGNLLIRSPNWNAQFSALTWMKGSNGALANGFKGGAVSAANSLVGSAPGDDVGSGGDLWNDGVTVLYGNRNWVITSPTWFNGKGAATWMNSSTGLLADASSGGVLSSANSLVGSTDFDQIGGTSCGDGCGGGWITALSDGNYVVNSTNRADPINTAIHTGAVTWGNGTSGTAGTVTAANSALVYASFMSEASPGQVLVSSASANGGAGGVYLVGATGQGSNAAFAGNPSGNATVGADWLANAMANGTNVLMQANNDITVNADITVSPSSQFPGASLTLEAGRSIAVNANTTTLNGNVTLVANDTAADGVVNANRDPGIANLSLGAATTLDAGTGRVTLKLLDGAGNTNNTLGTITQGAGASILASNLDVVTFGGASLVGSNQVNVFQLTNTGNAATLFDNVSTRTLTLGDYLNGVGVTGDAGSVSITTAGDLLVQSAQYGGVVSSSAVGDAATLAAAGNYYDGGTSLSAPNGRWLVYSTGPGLDNVTANALGAGDFKQFAAPIGATPAQSSGNGFLYSISPTLTASLTGAVNGGFTKSYDGTTQIALNSNNFVVANSLQNSDVISVAPMTGNFNSKNVGVATTVSATGLSVSTATDSSTGAAVYGYQFAVDATATGGGSITPMTVTLTAPSVTKTYDGLTTYNTQAADLTAFSNQLGVSGDTITAATLSYADKNAGSANKAVSLSAFTINDGNGGANYTVTTNGNTTSTINPLTQVTWAATKTSGNWSDPANWTGNLVPDGANVLAVSVLNGATVTYDLTTPTTVQAINLTGSFTMTTGTLAVTGNLNTPQYTQTGGSLTGTGSLTVTNSFSQSAGSIAMAGPVSITQSSGNLVVGSISASGIALDALSGAISQTAPLVTAGLLKARASNGLALTDPANAVAAFSATTTGIGDIALTNVSALDVQGIAAANGNVILDNTGAISSSGTMTANAGAVSITAHSPITLGNSVSASGNIVLAALTPDGTSNITLNGSMTSTAGGISIQAYNNFIQNSNLSAALAIDVSTIAGSMSFGPGAYSIGNPVSYTVNGAPYLPPWIASTLSGGATDFVVAFLDQFQAVLDAQQVASVSDPLGLLQRGQEGIVVEGEICKP